MAPLKIKDIVKVSSEDENFPAINLLQDGEWLSNVVRQSGEEFIEFAFPTPVQIHYIDIGYSNVASLEIYVRSSSWPLYRDYMLFMPTVVLQNMMDARTGQNKTGCKMFSYNDHFKEDIANQCWDRVKLILYQPHARIKQISIKFIRFGTPRNSTNTTSNKELGKPGLHLSLLQKEFPPSQVTQLQKHKFRSKLSQLSEAVDGNINTEIALCRSTKILMASKFKSATKLPSSIEIEKRKCLNKLYAHQKPMNTTEENSPSKRAKLQPETSNKTSANKYMTKQRKPCVPLSDHDKKCDENIFRSSGKENNRTACSPKITTDKMLHRKLCKSLNRVSTNISPKISPSLSADTRFDAPRNSSTNMAITDACDTSIKSCKSTVNVSDDDNEGCNKMEEKIARRISHAAPQRNQMTLHEIAESAKGTMNSSKYVSGSSSLQKNHDITPSDEIDEDIIENRNPTAVFEQTNLIIDNSHTSSTSSVVFTKPVYTDHQIKQLKKAIKRFFNLLNIDNFDPNTQKVKDLRKRFEETHKIKLNKDGRSYFCDVTTRYINLVYSVKKSKEDNASSHHKSVKKATKEPSLERLREREFLQNQADSLVTNDELSVGTNEDDASLVQCPLCFCLFDMALIHQHAASCCEPAEFTSSGNSEAFNAQHGVESIPNCVVDCTETSCLTQEEQLKWIDFSREPKPYQERLNRSNFEGCSLARCPSCGQKYKSSEIEMHTNDCIEKVNSGCTRMGLYLISKKKAGKQTVSSKQRKISKEDTIVID